MSDSGVDLAKMRPSRNHHGPSQATRSPEVTFIHPLLEIHLKSPEGWTFLKHLVIQITCLKEALSRLFIKEEIAERLMLLNHLFESRTFSSNYHPWTNVPDLVAI